MEVLGEKLNAHLPQHSTLKSSGIFSSKRFELGSSSSVGISCVWLANFFRRRHKKKCVNSIFSAVCSMMTVYVCH